MKIMKQIIGVPVGVFLIVLAINTMFAPHNVAGGGVGGISIIMKHLFSIEMAITALTINSVLLVIGYLTLGKAFFVKTVYGTLLMPIFIGIIPVTAFSDDVLLSVLFGSFLTAVGVNVLYYLNASSGGTTIPPLVLKKYFGMNPSLGLLISDATVVVASLFIFGVEQFMYSALVIVLTSIIMEYMMVGLTRKKVVYIMSDQLDEIAAEIMNDVGRGATRLQAKGAYTKQDKEVLMVVLNASDFKKLQQIVERYDDKAFVIEQSVSRVMGEAFTYHSVVQ